MPAAVTKTSESKGTIGYKARRELLLSALPAHDWKITPAAISVGFDKDYARSPLHVRLKKDDHFQWKMGLMRAMQLQK